LNKNNINPHQKIYFFFILLFIVQFYYFFIDFFLFGLFAHYGYNLGIGLLLLGLIIIHGLILLTLLQLYQGLIHRKPWTRKFTIFYLIWASLWAIWGLSIGNNVIVHLVLLLLYILMIFYLTTPMVQWYFKKIYRYGKYVLYTKLVTLRSGLQLPIYFFSQKNPKSGHPTDLPEGYTVKENEKSHMPYLKKKEHKHVSKTKSKPKKQKTEQINKPKPEIIYVVNNEHDNDHPEAWIVKSHTTTYEYVQTKQKAIQKARDLARKFKARVLVQNVHGKFSHGFTPRTPKKQ